MGAGLRMGGFSVSALWMAASTSSIDAHAVDRLQGSLPAVIIHQRGGLLFVGVDAALEHLGIVVGAQRLAAGGRFAQPVLDPALQDRAVDPELDHAVELEALLLEHPVERDRLRDRARETIEDEAVPGVRLADAVGDDGYDDFVGHQLAAIHDRLGAQADQRAGLDGRPQHVPGRELHDAVLLHEPLCLSALPRPRGSEHDQSHRYLASNASCRGCSICAFTSSMAQTKIRSDVPPR